MFLLRLVASCGPGILAPVAGAGATSLYLSLEAWDRPLTGDEVTRIPVLREAVARLDADPGLRLVIHYPGGEEGAFRALNLRAWLIALGVASERLRLVPGSGRDDRLELELEERTP
ncbi:MAG: hypothetical protein D6721_08045 [Gammaproteobacteria bacterium]|nr:MAG: hypothetical protein D6721_08045 [Gammaproteobacteria bacterium]